MEYSKSKIFKRAWELFRWSQTLIEEYRFTFAKALKRAWEEAKEEARYAAEAIKKGIMRVHYSVYKNSYSDCETVEGSYDKSTKTIEVMTNVKKVKRIRPSFASKYNNGICRICGTYCYGDCTAH